MRIILFIFFFFCFTQVFSQDLKTKINENKKGRDSLRKALDTKLDSVVFDATYIRFTTLKLSRDSIKTIPIDTTLVGIQNFNVLYQPRNPTIGTGNLGLAARPMLFENTKNIGFDVGFHTLDYYLLNHEDIKFYAARTQFSSLYYVTGGDNEQVFKVIHSQNVNKNLNFALNYNRNGANGDFTFQRGDDLNIGISSWYQGPKKKYNLFASIVINTLKAQENGSIQNQDLYNPETFKIDRLAEATNLKTAKQLWRKTSYQLKNSYNLNNENNKSNLSSENKIIYSISYSKSGFNFRKNEEDNKTVIPAGKNDLIFTNDSTDVKQFQNEILYSFVLKNRNSSFIKNEVKLNVGLRNDIYNYTQTTKKNEETFASTLNTNFSNTSFLGNLGYRFSDKFDFNATAEQIFQGRNIGDFIYETKSNLFISKSLGFVELSAYYQNKSPQEIFNRFSGNHYEWQNNFEKTKTLNFSFNYVNQKYRFDIGASYQLIDNHIYFGLNDAKVQPLQANKTINLMKFNLGKKITLGKFNLDSYLVYQLTDQNNILRTPTFYTFNSLYVNKTFFKVLKTQIGCDVRYNTNYLSVRYAPAINQFYNGADDVYISNKPVADFWIKVGLRRANLFLKYDYVNQGLFSNGFYTVDRYPMADRLLKYGVIWNFYD
ncbi:MAG: putative porin [Sphingobacteriaceae bacterium]|nr:putative porin [Sphingobacteriaceae bacterium]